MSAAPHAVTSLTLENFRNYRTLTLNVPARPVVLTGHNGAGKTNILEAISLLSPGRGLRSAKLREMDNRAGGAWVVAAEVTTNGEVTQIGTGRDTEAQVEKRILKINGEKERKLSALAQHVAIQWLTPSMDQVFIEGGSARRRWLDRIVYGFDPEHAARVSAYELATRERNRLLSDIHGADTYWLSVLEQQMAEHAVAMTLARKDTVKRIMDSMNEGLLAFPTAELQLQGAIEQWLSDGLSALETEAKFADRLMELRHIDAASGRANEGPQKSHLHVIHNPRNLPAEQCSTGEQKALLLAVTLAAARARMTWCGQPPVLLFDEVIAHLDVDKRRALFDLISTLTIQAWMTGTDAADFQGLEGGATHLKIDSGKLRIGAKT